MVAKNGGEVHWAKSLTVLQPTLGNSEQKKRQSRSALARLKCKAQPGSLSNWCRKT